MGTVGPTHVIDDVLGASPASEGGRVRICDSYMFPLSWRKKGRCSGAFRCRDRGLSKCKRGHPDPFEYLHIAAVATVIVSYDWHGRRIFAAAEPRPPALVVGGGLARDDTPWEWSPLCPVRFRDPTGFPEPRHRRREQVAWARAALPPHLAGQRALSFVPSLPLGEPTADEQEGASLAVRGSDGVPLWPDDAPKWRHCTFSKDIQMIIWPTSPGPAFVPFYHLAGIVWNHVNGWPSPPGYGNGWSTRNAPTDDSSHSSTRPQPIPLASCGAIPVIAPSSQLLSQHIQRSLLPSLNLATPAIIPGPPRLSTRPARAASSRPGFAAPAPVSPGDGSEWVQALAPTGDDQPSWDWQPRACPSWLLDTLEPPRGDYAESSQWPTTESSWDSSRTSRDLRIPKGVPITISAPATPENIPSCHSLSYLPEPLLARGHRQCILSPNAAIGVRDQCPVYSSNGVRPELATLTLLRRAAAHQAHHVHMGLLGLNSLPSSYSRFSFSVRSWPCQVLVALSMALLHLESVFYWRFHWHYRGGPPGGHF